MARHVVLGLVQMQMEDDLQSNIQHALSLVERAAAEGAQVVCLPELFTTRYFAQYESSPEPPPSAVTDSVPGRVSAALSRCALDNGIVLVGGSIFESADGRTYNTSMVFDADGERLGKYRKTHIPQDQYYFEKEYFAPGDTGFQVFATRFGRIAPLICYDQGYPEAARACALGGADIIFYPTAIGTVKGIAQTEGNWHKAWENVMRGHAIANGIVVAGVNRAGREDRMRFWGGSFVIDAFGKTLKRAGSKEQVLVQQIDLDHGLGVREGWRFFHNRRPEMYGKLVEREEG
jgi:agmatine deiminase